MLEELRQISDDVYISDVQLHIPGQVLESSQVVGVAVKRIWEGRLRRRLTVFVMLLLTILCVVGINTALPPSGRQGVDGAMVVGFVSLVIGLSVWHSLQNQKPTYAISILTPPGALYAFTTERESEVQYFISTISRMKSGMIYVHDEDGGGFAHPDLHFCRHCKASYMGEPGGCPPCQAEWEKNLPPPAIPHT